MDLRLSFVWTLGLGPIARATGFSAPLVYGAQVGTMDAISKTADKKRILEYYLQLYLSRGALYSSTVRACRVARWFAGGFG
jgi:hypothetical protein